MAIHLTVGSERPSVRRRPAARRGSSLIWTMVVLVVLIGFCSLAVDLGRVQLVKGELRLAADAAARHAAHTFLNSGSVSAARAAAVDSADDNTADGSNPVVLDPVADVRFGTYDTVAKTFTPAAAGTEATATAIEVTARRTTNRGNPVKLSFARVVGRQTFDVRAKAVARINSRRPGIVGLDSVTTTGSSGVGNVTNSYRSKAGAFVTGSTTTFGRGTIASNGNISLGGNTTINGDARPGVGKSVTLSGSASITGTRTALARPLDYPMPTAGTAATSNDNSSIPSSCINSGRDVEVGGTGTLTLPGGTYYLDDLHVKAGATLAFSGAATICLTGNLRVDGQLNTTGSNPSNLRVICTGYQLIDMSSNVRAYMDLYAPGCAFTMSGSAVLCGSVVAKSVALTGNANVIFDESLTISLSAVSLVQ